MPKKETQRVSYPLPSDWRGEVMSEIREIIQKADPEIIEDVKWKTASNPAGNLVWYRDGMLTTGEIYKRHLRLSFAKGVELKKNDPSGLINSYRAVLIYEDTKLDKTAFKNLIREAVELNKKGLKK